MTSNPMIRGLVKRKTAKDKARCPECRAWYGAWRGATWHSDACPNRSKPDPTDKPIT